MSSEVIYIAGRYNKYLRNLSQSPWIDKDDVRIKDSVQELIEDGLHHYLQYEKTVFSSSGREDVDVRMLGRGRPFVFKMLNPFNPSNYNRITMSKIQAFINKKYPDKIKVRDLQVVSKEEVSNHIKVGEESKSKEYRALCCCSRRITQEDIKKINDIVDLDINQRTPIRVLHRRTLVSRKRRICKLKIDEVKIGDFQSIKQENINNLFSLTLVTEAGTYIKEFVHGDFGRTKPSLYDLLGDCDTDLVELDVTEVYLDWPAKIEDNIQSISSEAQSMMSSSEMEVSEINLSELYSKAQAAMRHAESLPRGDERQDHYVKARRLFEDALSLIERLSLFSDNEQIDDVATADLKYLLTPAYLSKIALSSECSPNRLDTFTRAETFAKKFLELISSYGLGDKRVDRIIKSDDTENDRQQQDSIETAIQTRSEKIEKFKRMKTLEFQLDELNRKIKSNDNVDEEITREYYISLVKKWIEDTCDSMEQEIKPALLFERNRPKSSSSKEPIPRQMPIDPTKSMTIVRDSVQKAVFGLGYPSRPTVTVDEFISKKINDGDLAFHAQKEVYANSLQRYAEQPTLLKEQEEQSDTEREEKEDRDDEEELARKRTWDEFKDENPRGSGNRHNMG